MIDVHCASLTSQGVQHRVFYRDGHPSRYQSRPTGLNFGEQTGTGVFPWGIAVPRTCTLHCCHVHDIAEVIYEIFDISGFEAQLV